MFRMTCRQAILSGLLISLSLASRAQTLKVRTPEPPEEKPAFALPTPLPVNMEMSVPAGTPIKVALDSDVRIRKVGQTIHAKTIEPVFAFDKLVIPLGTTVTGKISGIDPVGKKRRTLDALDGDFSPIRTVHVQFDELIMNDGLQVQIRTVASPAPNGILRLVPANAKAEKKNRVEDAASKKVSEARQQVRERWSGLKKQIHEPGKLHKLERMAIAQLPVHPQYMDAGTSFNADLQQPLDFGSEALKPEALTAIGTPPPAGSIVRARLITPLSSASSKKGEDVEAMITEPLVASNQLILPEGSVIRGSVTQAQPARRLARNGQLRILFHAVAPPNGVEQKVVTSLEGVAVANGEHLKLDREGGAQVTTPRTRYLTTGIQVMLAATSAMPDGDRGLHHGADGGGDLGGSAANGASGFRFVGMAVGMVARSRMVATGFGAYGAANSIYSHFLARGRDVVYPKDMGMIIGLRTRESDRETSKGPAPGAAGQPMAAISN